MATTSCVFVSFLFLATVWSATDDICNEAVCASVVSKCQLLERCRCDRSNSSCTLDCFKCLDYLYMECCSCVSMCPKANHTDSLISMQSHAEELSEPLPSLFTTLTEEEDQLLRWTTYSFPVQVSFVTTSGSEGTQNTFASGTKVTLKDDGLDEEEDIQVQDTLVTCNESQPIESMILFLQTNCTVAFMADCMPFNKCKSSCSSMGASSYRWFHDGCCQCVGPRCLNYGVSESKCRMCPLKQTGENGPMVVDSGSSEKTTVPDGDDEVGPGSEPDGERQGPVNAVNSNEGEQSTPTTKKTSS